MYQPEFSGRMWYGPPHYWRLIIADDAATLVAAETPSSLTIIYALCGIFACVAWAFVAAPHIRDMRLIIGGYIACIVVAILICVFIVISFRSQRARGPILTLSRIKEHATMERLGVSWPFSRIVRWEIVYANRLTNGHNVSFHFEGGAELQMIVRNDDGEEVGIPIVGAVGKNDRQLVFAAETLSQMTKAPFAEIQAVRLKKS